MATFGFVGTVGPEGVAGFESWALAMTKHVMENNTVKHEVRIVFMMFIDNKIDKEKGNWQWKWKGKMAKGFKENGTSIVTWGAKCPQSNFRDYPASTGYCQDILCWEFSGVCIGSTRPAKKFLIPLLFRRSNDNPTGAKGMPPR
jgi:hypothetical protein